MALDLAPLRRVFRRSRLRVQIVLVLAVWGEATLRDLAVALGADPSNAWGALRGDGERYAVADALVALGLVGVRVRRGEEVYSLSARGRAVASWLRRGGHRPPVVPVA